ncbi:hypothetical protein, partial [Streptomyces mirabilis]|uniref:hypothetical protein n=1 Tax=Streptomyces mirabilis TaxID=68239 RepID=UPI0036A17067
RVMWVSVVLWEVPGWTVQGHKIRTYRFSFQGRAGNFAGAGRGVVPGVCGVHIHWFVVGVWWGSSLGKRWF